MNPEKYRTLGNKAWWHACLRALIYTFDCGRLFSEGATRSLK